MQFFSPQITEYKIKPSSPSSAFVLVRLEFGTHQVDKLFCSNSRLSKQQKGSVEPKVEIASLLQK